MKIRQISIEELPVVIIDGLFSENEAKKIRTIVKSFPLVRQGLTMGDDPTTAHYAAIGDYAMVKNFPFYQKILKETENMIGEECECDRMIYREFVFGDQPEFHTDYNVRGLATAILYLNETWSERDRGETLFSDSEGIGTSVLPFPGRAVIFDGRVKHTANAPARTTYIARQLLVLNFYIKSLGPPKYAM